MSFWNRAIHFKDGCKHMVVDELNSAEIGTPDIHDHTTLKDDGNHTPKFHWKKLPLCMVVGLLLTLLPSCSGTAKVPIQRPFYDVYATCFSAASKFLARCYSALSWASWSLATRCLVVAYRATYDNLLFTMSSVLFLKPRKLEELGSDLFVEPAELPSSTASEYSTTSISTLVEQTPEMSKVDNGRLAEALDNLSEEVLVKPTESKADHWGSEEALEELMKSKAGNWGLEEVLDAANSDHRGSEVVDKSLKGLDESLEDLDESLEELDESLKELDESLEELDESLEELDESLKERNSYEDDRVEVGGYCKLVALCCATTIVTVALVFVLPLVVNATMQHTNIAVSMPFLNFSACHFVRGSNYTDVFLGRDGKLSKLPRTVLKAVTAVVKITCAIAALKKLSTSGSSVHSSGKATALSAPLRKATALSAPAGEFRRPNTKVLVVLGILVLMNQVGSVASTAQANSSHPVCSLDDEPVYQCFEPPEKDFCPVTPSTQYSAFAVHTIHICLSSYPKHLLSLACAKSSFETDAAATHSGVLFIVLYAFFATENAIVLSGLIFVMGPFAPVFYLLSIFYPRATRSITRRFTRCFKSADRVFGVLWRNRIRPGMSLVLRRCRVVGHLAFNTVNQVMVYAGFALEPYLDLFFHASLVLDACVYTAMYSEVLVSLIPPFLTHLVVVTVSATVLTTTTVCVHWLAASVKQGLRRVQGAMNVGLNGAMWLFAAVVTTAALVLNWMWRVLGLVQVAVGITLYGGATWLYRRVFQPHVELISVLFLVCAYVGACTVIASSFFMLSIAWSVLISIAGLALFIPPPWRPLFATFAMPRNQNRIQRDPRFLSSDIVQPSVVRKSTSKPTQIAKSVVIYKAPQVCRTTPVVYDDRHLLWYREHCCYLPDDWKTPVVNGTSITGEEESMSMSVHESAAWSSSLDPTGEMPRNLSADTGLELSSSLTDPGGGSTQSMVASPIPTLSGDPAISPDSDSIGACALTNAELQWSPASSAVPALLPNAGSTPQVATVDSVDMEQGTHTLSPDHDSGQDVASPLLTSTEPVSSTSLGDPAISVWSPGFGEENLIPTSSPGVLASCIFAFRSSGGERELLPQAEWNASCDCSFWDNHPQGLPVQAT